MDQWKRELLNVLNRTITMTSSPLGDLKDETPSTCNKCDGTEVITCPVLMTQEKCECTLTPRIVGLQ